jgi:hypothetical protein
MQLDAELSNKIGAWFGEHNISSSITLAKDSLHFYCSRCHMTQDISITETFIGNTIVAVEVPSK